MPSSNLPTPEEATKVKEALKTLSDIASKIENLPPDQKAEAVSQLYEESFERPHKPRNYKATTVASYYTAKHAQWLKKFLDKLLLPEGHENDMWFDRKDFNLGSYSLYLKINQAWQYLIENLDTKDLQYEKLRRSVAVEKYRGGVKLRWRSPEGLDASEQPTMVERDSENPVEIPKWKQQLETFLEEGKEGQILSIKGKELGSSDLEYVQTLAGGLTSFHILKCESNTVKILMSEKMTKE